MKEFRKGSEFIRCPDERGWKLEFFEQEFKVFFIPFSEDPWKDFVRGAISLLEEKLEGGFEFFGNNLQEVYYFVEELKRNFTGKLDVRKLSISGERAKYGEKGPILCFGIQRKGQRKIVDIFWEASLQKRDVYFFLDNRLIDRAVLEGDPKRALFFRIMRVKPIKLDNCIEYEEGKYFLKLRGERREIKNRAGGSFDIEIFPVFVERGGKFILKGIRVMGRDLVEFCKALFVDYLFELREYRIWGRDWKNERIDLRGLRVRKLKRGSLREAFFEFEEELELEGMIPFEADPRDPRGKMGEILEVARKHHNLISSLRMEGEEYSKRYSRILREVESWEEAVKVSKAAKLKMWEKVSKHTLYHVLMGMAQFLGLPYAESEDLSRVWLPFSPDEELKIGIRRLENCDCEEICLGCGYNPGCVEENRYLDREICYKALEDQIFHQEERS